MTKRTVISLPLTQMLANGEPSPREGGGRVQRAILDLSIYQCSTNVRVTQSLVTSFNSIIVVEHAGTPQAARNAVPQLEDQGFEPEDPILDLKQEPDSVLTSVTMHLSPNEERADVL